MAFGSLPYMKLVRRADADGPPSLAICLILPLRPFATCRSVLVV
jgi:hypothetical protein